MSSGLVDELVMVALAIAVAAVVIVAAFVYLYILSRRREAGGGTPVDGIEGPGEEGTRKCP